jgi:hypothetical protein
MAKAKERQHALAKKRGTTGHDPFIPARNARPLPANAGNPIIQKYRRIDEERYQRDQGCYRRILVVIATLLLVGLNIFPWRDELVPLFALLPFPILATHIGLDCLMDGTITVVIFFFWHHKKRKERTG